MKNDINSCPSNRSLNSAELDEKITQMRLTANQNHLVCREKERFFYFNTDKTPLTAQSGPIYVSDAKTHTEVTYPPKRGYLAQLRTRFLLAIILFGSLILYHRYYDDKSIALMENLKALFTQNLF